MQEHKVIITYGGCQAEEPERKTARLPLEGTEPLFVRIRGLLQSLGPKQLVGSLWPGADIRFARAALAERIPLHVVLPGSAAMFRQTVVAPAGEPWLSHYPAGQSISWAVVIACTPLLE